MGSIQRTGLPGIGDITNFADQVFRCYARKQSSYFVNKVFPHFSVSDLRADLIERARKMAVSKKRLQEGKRHEWADMDDEELLRTSTLIVTDENGKRGITLAAILLFGTDEMIGSACAHHKTDCIVRVYNQDRYDDRDVILTNLLDSYDRMIAFGQKHLNDSFVLDGIQSVSARDAILREIVSNSLAHRDYSNPYVAQFLIEKDRIIVKNGNRAHGIGALSIKSFEPFPKNPSISKVFREMGLADELGSGMRNSYKFTKLYSGAEPEFIEGDIFKIIIPLTTGAMTKVGPGTDIETNTETAQNSTETSIETNTETSTEIAVASISTKMSAVERDIRRLIGEDPHITIDQMVEKTNWSKGGIRYQIDKMKKAGKLSREGSQKDGKWVIKE